LHNLSPPLIHGDIKAVSHSVCDTSTSHRVFQANILIDEEEHARLADFGLITISETQSFITTISHASDQGSTRWMAPELFKEGVRKSRMSDVYAFGMTILEVRAMPCPLE
jgi:serine/threonine protein kinase